MDIKEKIIKELKKVNREGIEDLISYLNKSDFFEAPASARYHNSFPGGLAEHSWNVFKILSEKNDRYELGLNKDNIRIMSLLHDIDKTFLYKIEMWSRKDKYGQWEKYPKYVWDEKGDLNLGHGVKSIMIISNFIEMENKEVTAIRWHMGFSVPKEDYKDLNRAMENNIAVTALHSADLEASRFLEDREPNEKMMLNKYKGV